MAGGDGAPELEAVADELYGLAPTEFTAARDARAAEARRAGRRDLAEAIKRLRRPTAGAWLANVLAHRAPDDLGRLLDLGASLRQAQSELAGDALRQLSRQRQQVISGLVTRAVGLATEIGSPPGPAAARELHETLDAALADPDAAEAVRAGRLAAALSYSGLGEAGAVAAPKRPAPATPAEKTRQADKSQKAGQAQKAEQAKKAEEAQRAQRAEHAKKAVADARAALEAAGTELDARRQAADDAARQLEERRQQLAAIEERYRAAQEAVEEAQRGAQAREAERADAAAAVDEARDRLARAEAEAASAG